MSAVAEPVTAVHMTATPRIAFRDPAKAIEFYQRALGAKESFRFQVGDSIAHAELYTREAEQKKLASAGMQKLAKRRGEPVG